MKSLWKDESADSMIVVTLVLGVLSFGMLYLFLTNTANLPIEQINTMIDQGIMTHDTTSRMQSVIDMWKAAPFFFIIGLVLFSYERMKGESVTSGTYFSYLVLMIICIQMSAYLVWVAGTTLDSVTNVFEGLPSIMNYSAEWDTSATRGVALAGIYYAAMLPGYLGSVLYMIHPILRQRETGFFGKNDSVDGDQEYITNYSVEQM